MPASGLLRGLLAGDVLDDMAGVEALRPEEIVRVFLVDGFDFFGTGFGGGGGHFLDEAFPAQLLLDGLAGGGCIEAAVAVGAEEARQVLGDELGIDGARVGGGELGDENFIDGGSLRGFADGAGALGFIGDLEPAGMTGDEGLFLADELFGGESAVDVPRHGYWTRLVALMRTVTPPVRSGATISGKPEGWPWRFSSRRLPG